MPIETTIRLYRVPRWAICYIRYTIECYDGMAVVSTLDPDQGIVRIQVAPGCEDMIEDLMAHLCEKEKIPIRKIDGRSCKDNPAGEPLWDGG